MISLPPLYIEKMRRLLGEDAPAFLSIYQHEPTPALRVNTLKLAVSDFVKRTPFDLLPVAWCPQGFWVSTQGKSPGRHPFHAAGLYYIQEAAAMAAAQALAPQPGERILDLAAAPGGKSTHILSLMNNQGFLVANEMHPKRAWELAENLERWGASNAILTNETPQRLASHFGDTFDRILVDAPCSGEGMFRKSEPARADWSPGLVQSCATRQSGILEQAARMLVPGGRLVYSTCTFSPEENEGVLARFLAQHTDFELVSTIEPLEFSKGRPDWVQQVPLLEPARLATLSRSLRLWPHQGMGEGHFIGILQRKAGAETGGLPTGGLPTGGLSQARLPRLPEDITKFYRQFCRQHLLNYDDGGALLLKGDQLFRLPAARPELRPLHVLRPGLWLGTLRTGRFEPSHSLALSVAIRQAANVAILDDEQARRYLRGEPLEMPGAPGWVLMTLAGFGLGWGKRVANIIKNAYPKGLRWH